MKEIKEFLNLAIHFNDDIVISVRDILILAVVLFLATVMLRIINKIITRNLPLPNKRKVNTVFSYFRYLVYMIILFIMLHSFGVPVTGVFAASAALLLGIGLALQTLFQDIISGVFILVDQTVHVGDIIELDGKIGRVDEIKLRTTRATTIDNKVLIIPNHFYLTNSLYNWTQNGATTRESVSVGVAYGSDVQLVKKILLEVAKNHPAVLDTPEPAVLFTEFGESSLNFKVSFTLNDSFNVRFPQSDMRFEIDRLFREHKISIPFPQRDIRVINEPFATKS